MYPKSTPKEPRYVVMVWYSRDLNEVQRRYVDQFYGEGAWQPPSTSPCRRATCQHAPAFGFRLSARRFGLQHASPYKALRSMRCRQL